MSGDICGGNGGEIERRRSFVNGTFGSGEGIEVVSVDKFVIGTSDGKCEFGICLWLIGVDKFDNDAVGIS